MKIYTAISFFILLLFTLVQAGDTNLSNCYPITSADLVRKNAPNFGQFPAKVKLISHPAPIKVKNNFMANQFRTVLHKGAKEGANFAGHYTIVGWGCGGSCLQFAIVDAETGQVLFPDFSVDGVHVIADEFEPNARSQYWGLRYRLDSKLLIVVGSPELDPQLYSVEPEKREGAFYYVFEKGKLTPVFSVTVHKKLCDKID